MILCCALGPDLSPGAPRLFAWQARHLVTSTFISRGRRGTNSSTVVLRGRRGTHGTVCPLGPDLSPGAPRLFAWQAWHLVTCVALGNIHFRFAWQAWCLVTSCDIHHRFAWQACHLEICTFLFSHSIFFYTFCHTPSLTHRHRLSVTHHLSHTDFVTRLLSHTTLSHTNFVTHHLSHTNFVTHHLSHTSLSHPTFHTPSFTHHIVTHHLSHITLSHALFHTQLSHTPSFTHRFVTHTIFLSHTPAFTYNFVLHNFILLLDPPPPSLSFLPSPSPLQHLVLIVQRR